MRIAIVIERLEAWRGGAETSTAELADQLVRRGHVVHILTTSNLQAPAGLMVHSLPVPAWLKPFRLDWFLDAASRVAQAGDYDIVHAISPLASADVYQPRGGSVRETLERNVALRDRAWPQRAKRIAQWLSLKQQRLLRHEGRICRPGGPLIACVSRYVVDQFAQHYGMPAERLALVFNGVNPPDVSAEQARVARIDLRRRHGAPDGDTVFLAVAQNFRLKGVHRLIEAAAVLVQRGPRDLHVWVVGRDDTARYVALARRLGVEDRVTFIGPSSQVPHYMAAADALVHPTYFDPCSRVVLEAMTLGLPTLTTKFNGAVDMIEAGINGLVIDSPENVGSLAAGMEQLLDADRRKALGTAARCIAPQLSMSRHVDELLLLYDRICRQRANRDGLAR